MSDLIRKKGADILFYIAIVLSGFTLIKTYIERSSLPPGVCPIDNNTGLYQLAIGLLILSFIVSLFDKKQKG